MWVCIGRAREGMRIWQNICGSQHEWRGSDATPCSSSALLPILSDKYALYKPRQPLAHPYVGGNPTHPTEPRSISPVTTAFVSCLVVVSMPWSPNGNHKNLQYTYAYCSFICHNWPPCLWFIIFYGIFYCNLSKSVTHAFNIFTFQK